MGADQGNYAYAAWAWLDGATPYRDVMVWRPPLTLHIFATAEALFGRSMVGLRIVDLALQAATAGLVAWITHEGTDNSLAAAIAGAGYGLAYYQFDYWHSAQTDGWVTLPVAIAIAATIRSTRRESPRTMLLTGAALAAAAFLKYPALAGLLPVTVWLVARRRHRIARHTTYAAAGFAAVTAIIVGWLYLSGALPAFIDHHTRTLSRYAAHSSSGRGLQGLLRFFQILASERMLRLVFPGTIVGLLAGLAWGLTWLAGRLETDSSDEIFAPRSPVFTLTALAWLVAGIAMCFSQGKYLRYHYLPMIAPATLFLGLVVHQISERRAQYATAGLVAALMLTTVAVTDTPGAPSLTTPWRITTGQLDTDDYWHSSAFVESQFSLTDNLELADWLRTHTEPDERAFIFGRAPFVNYWAGRKSATRFIYNYPLRYPWRDPLHERQLMEGLRQTRPQIVVVASRDASYRTTGTWKDSREVFRDFRPLRNWVRRHYRSTTTIGRFQVYRRVSDGS